jgi:photosystem II stability/assembly factor-like uncharacterized protein
MPNPAPSLLWWLHGFSSADVWAVGGQGTILHFDGNGWTATPSTSTATLSGIWGASPSELWAVGGSDTAPTEPIILKWNGTQWSNVPLPGVGPGALFKVWGADRTHVFAVGAKGIVLSYDGNAWTQAPPATQGQLTTVQGRAQNDVFAVGGMGNALILHFDGQSWTPDQTVSTLSPLLGVYADPAGPVIVVGQQGTIASRTTGAEAWHSVDPLPTPDCLHNVAPYAGGYVAVGGNLLSPSSGLHGVLLRSGSALSKQLP